MGIHVAITADPYIPIPPEGYGGIERVVSVLVAGLIERGHHVTLIAHPASTLGTEIVPYGLWPRLDPAARARELLQVGCALWKRRRQVSIVHSFGRLAALLPVLPLRRLPKLQSYHRPEVPWRGVKAATLLAGGSIRFTGCSESVHRSRPGQGRYGGEWLTLFNPIPLARYEYVPAVAPHAPLVYLGKIERGKGVHLAIEIARKAGRRLVIAGNLVESGANAGYFAREIEPHLAPGEVDYVGEADDARKNTLLGQSAALLFPTSYEETFGLVMAEAMACGTPAIGFARGAVPEVIRNGVNGFVCTTVDEAAAAVAHIPSIDRAEVRRDCEARFGDTAFVDRHVALYEEMIARCNPRSR